MTTRTEKVALTGVKETLLITLYAKARESRRPDSLLRDTYAADAVERIDYDFGKLRVRRDDAVGIAMRALAFDRLVTDFVARHPDAIVLQLGCGLDTRIQRLAPPAGVRWYDVDYPDVIALREKLFPPRDGYTTIGSSVTDLDWLTRVPRDAPTLVVAEGLVMYLTEADVRDVFRAITAHASGGEIAFDVLSRLGLKLVQHNRMVRATGAVLSWSLDDPRRVETLVPPLKLIGEYAPYDPDSAEFKHFRLVTRAAIRLMNAFPPLRRLGRLLRYRF